MLTTTQRYIVAFTERGSNKAMMRSVSDHTKVHYPQEGLFGLPHSMIVGKCTKDVGLPGILMGEGPWNWLWRHWLFTPKDPHALVIKVDENDYVEGESPYGATCFFIGGEVVSPPDEPIKAVEFLLEHLGHDWCERPNHAGGTALNSFPLLKLWDCVVACVRAGADVNLQHPNGSALIREAVSYADVDTIRQLLELGATWGEDLYNRYTERMTKLGWSGVEYQTVLQMLDGVREHREEPEEVCYMLPQSVIEESTSFEDFIARLRK